MNNLRIINAHSWHFYDAWRRHSFALKANRRPLPPQIAPLTYLAAEMDVFILCVSRGFAWPPAKCLPQTGQHFSSLFAWQQQQLELSKKGK